MTDQVMFFNPSGGWAHYAYRNLDTGLSAITVVDSNGRAMASGLTTLQSLQLAKILIADSPVKGTDHHMEQITFRIDTLIEREETRPLREARNKVLEDLGVNPEDRFTTDTLHTLLDHIKTLKENTHD